MVKLPRGDCSKNRGAWQLSESGAPRMSCPHCGRQGSLEGYVIYRDGNVEPSVHCQACGFDDNVKLLGWNPGGG